MADEIQTMKTMIQGLETRRDDLINARDIFLKAQGLDEQVEKERQKIGELETDIEAFKEDLSAKQDAKKEALRATMLSITVAMNKVIPEGDGCIEINDEGVNIGWFKDNAFRPYDGLSGGEKVIFDSALCYALLAGCKNKIIVLEGGELDNKNLDLMISHLSGLKDTQFLVNTCHAPEKTPKGWKTITL